MRFYLPTLCLGFLLLSSTAQAEEYFIELGRASAEAEAQQIWSDIRTANPKILARYEFYPNRIVDAQGNSSYRVQAGPMRSKQDAQRVCNRLFRRQVSCFVIEGFDPQNAKTFSNADAPAPAKFGFQDFLPWMQPQTAKEIPAAPPVQGQEKVSEPPKEAEKKSEKDADNSKNASGKPVAKAKVDVAEAIPVPVTESNEVTVPEAPAVFSFDTIFSSSEGDKKADQNAANTNPGWLSVQPFLNEESANAFWKTLKKRAPDETKNVNIQVIHPVVSHDIPKVILAIGSFESEAVAMQLCKKYISGSQYLECLFSPAPPEGESADAAEKRIASHSPEAEEYSLFWVDLLSEKSQDAVLERWERIRTDNDDLLADVRSQITASFSNPGMYMVRVGPLKMKSKANKLCGALMQRKITCKVSAL